MGAGAISIEPIYDPSNLPLSVYGIKLSYFSIVFSLRDQDASGSYKEAFRGLTSEQVCDIFIRKQTEKWKCSYCEYLRAIESPAFGLAQVFISHCWSYSFLDMIEALQSHFKDTPDIVVWIDLFSINQHNLDSMTVDYDWLTDSLRGIIRSIKNTVLVLDNWQRRSPLSRAWCLYELWASIDTNCKFEIVYSSDNSKGCNEIIERPIQFLNSIDSMISIETSQATIVNDCEMIFETVKGTVGFNKFDSTIIEYLKEWLVGSLEKKLQLDYDKENEEKLEYMRCLSVIYENARRLDEAREMFSSGFKLSEKVFGREHPTTFDFIDNYAEFEKTWGNYKVAEELYLDSLQRKRDYYGGEGCLSVWIATSRLASVYEKQEMFERAKLLWDSCWENKEIVYKATDPAALIALNNLGYQFFVSGEHDRAETILAECLQMSKSILGESNPKTLISYTNLAGLYEAIGELNRAQSLYKICLERRRELLGDSHLDTLSSMNSLARVFQSLGSLAQARDLLTDCLQKRRTVLGSGHPVTLSTITSLGGLLESMGDFDNAECLYVECLTRTKEILGEDHPDILASMQNLGLFYEQQGKYSAAEKSYRLCLEKKEEVLGRSHTDTLQCMYQYANMLMQQGDKFKAILMLEDLVAGAENAENSSADVLQNRELLVKAMERLRELFVITQDNDKLRKLLSALLLLKQSKITAAIAEDVKHQEEMLELYRNLAELHELAGDIDQAEEALNACVENRKAALGEDHAETFEAVKRLGEFLTRTGDHENAEMLLLESMQLAKESLGEDHQDTLNAMDTLAALYEKKGDVQEAKDLFIACVEKRKTILGESHPQTLEAMDTLARFYQGLGKHNKAKSLYVECLEKRKTILGEFHPKTLQSIETLASFHENNGQRYLAKSLLADSIEKRKTMYGESHPETLLTMKKLSVLHEKSSRKRRRKKKSPQPLTSANLGSLTSRK